jgi:hypothetical protein
VPAILDHSGARHDERVLVQPGAHELTCRVYKRSSRWVEPLMGATPSLSLLLSHGPFSVSVREAILTIECGDTSDVGTMHGVIDSEPHRCDPRHTSRSALGAIDRRTLHALAPTRDRRHWRGGDRYAYSSGLPDPARAPPHPALRPVPREARADDRRADVGATTTLTTTDPPRRTRQSR